MFSHQEVMLFYSFIVLICSWCGLRSVQGTLSKNKILGRINVSTVLQSDVLLPCFFDLSLYGLNKTSDASVVWSQMNYLYHSFVEITVQGESKFWKNKHGRIQSFPRQAESGNFSILTRKVNESDLDVYRCTLYEGFNCSIAYQELHLGFSANQYQKYIIPGGIGGAGLLILFVAFLYVFCKRRQQKRTETNCGSGCGKHTEHTQTEKNLLINPSMQTSKGSESNI